MHPRIEALMLVLILMSCSFARGADARDEASRLAAAAETELKAVCQNLEAALSPREKEHFQEAQRKWLSFRNAEASFQAGLTSGGGSAYSVDYLSERLEMTRERIKGLKTILESVK